MNFGALFPQTEYGSDPVAIRDYAQTVEGLGFTHVLTYEHVLGANPDRPGGWQGAYAYEDPFLEPFVLFTFMAAFTESLGFATGVLVLPQRQTALVAKQAATVDVLSRGRLRLGVGIGWNKLEYVALGQDFHTRGQRVEEQVELLRRLWTEPLVTFSGKWNTIPDAGINPLPVQRPIPIWFGGRADAVLRRIARMGDGWMPGYRTAEAAKPSLEQLDTYLAQHSRSRADIGIEPRINYGNNPDTWKTIVDDWRNAGATHISINTMGLGLDTPDEHLDALRHFAEEMGVGQ
ncbi:MAG: LLM class F420-dependent oxidoreductase [Chloroflexota bacterium]|nr:LLM class F420-dependent oxidoreductase [Chloroflexota bacterium]